ncbi:MAG TPA: phosphate acetyltransferase [Bacteroidales bacterium]|nr:phosphate acetyltransferase [Bacteroidales bacterium]
MSNNLYIAAAESGAGKSLITLGFMELLSRHVKRIGFFRPVVLANSEKDAHLRLVAERYQLPFKYNDMVGMSSTQALELMEAGDFDTLHTTIINKYKKLEKECDFILIEGTDFRGTIIPFEFDINAQFANNLGAPILAVINGHGKSAVEIGENLHIVRDTLTQEKCDQIGTCINRVDEKNLEAAKSIFARHGKPGEINFVVPEKSLLQKLTMRQVVNALGAKHIYGEDEYLNHDVMEFKVAAMGLEKVLKLSTDQMLVITPGDRTDVLVGLFMSMLADNFPKISGILLTGGIEPSEQLRRLMDGIKQIPMTVYGVETDTFETAMQVGAIHPVLTPENDRRLTAALSHFEANVDVDVLGQILRITRSRMITPIMFEYELFERARANRKHIVLPESEDERILRATEILLKRNVVDITLLGNKERILKQAQSLQLSLQGVNIIDPNDNDLGKEYAAEYYRLRKHKGITEEQALELMHDVSYLGTMMVHKGYADGMVSGAAHTTQHTIRPAFEFIKTKPGVSIVSSSFLMCFDDRVLVYGDCAVNPNPDAEQLADIAISSAETAINFGIEPRIAMLSYSTGESGKGEDVEKVRNATRIVRERRPDLKVAGPIQYDAAIEPSVALQKMPGSDVAGKATVFIFPDLNTGNNTYKAVQRAANAVAIGPVLQGLNKPVNDLSRGCLVKDIVNTVVITAIQAQGMEG